MQARNLVIAGCCDYSVPGCGYLSGESLWVDVFLVGPVRRYGNVIKDIQQRKARCDIKIKRQQLITVFKKVLIVSIVVCMLLLVISVL